MNVKVPTTGQIYSAETDLDLKPGTEVLVEADQVVEPGYTLCNKECLRTEGQGDKAAKIIRALSEEDIQLKKDLKEEAKKYLEEARAKVFRHSLVMKILDADLSFDRKKITFYFAAEGRIDFRALVSDMVGDFGKIIRLQQVGPRDATKHYGGFGKCGRMLCCATFLNNLESVTIDIAEAQEVSNAKASKLTGCCGKLMCCLTYEADFYKDIKKKLPKIGAKIKSPEGEGKVIAQDVFSSKVTIETKDGKKLEVGI